MSDSRINPQVSKVIAIEWLECGTLRLLDQRFLPLQESYLEITESEQVVAAIKDMVVRGAPAIGITAAYGIVLAAKEVFESHQSSWKDAIKPAIERLAHSRPTAVNLFWAIQKMEGEIARLGKQDPYQSLLKLAKQIHLEDIDANQSMGQAGSEFIISALGEGKKVQVLTHCNTGSLATGGYGTALGVIRSLYERGALKQVFADETRPWLQGARLTAWELIQDGIPVTLNADSAAAHLMQTGRVDWVIVGADRITANGDVANKIGTYNLAVLCKYHGVKFMVAAPTSTLDMDMKSGQQIPIEQRTGAEVTAVQGRQIAPEGVEVYNPVFDVTPACLIDAIVTEKGVATAPYDISLASFFD